MVLPRLTPRVSDATDTRLPRLPAGLPPPRGVLARGERGGAFHAHARAHRPQRHTDGWWLVIRRREETCAAHASRRGGPDEQEGLKGGGAPTIQRRTNERLHGDPKEEASDG